MLEKRWRPLETFKCKSGLATKGLKAYIMENAKTSGGRRLLSVGMEWDEAWQSFVSNFPAGDNDTVCNIAGSLLNVQVDADVYQFSFKVTRVVRLCKQCWNWKTSDTQYFGMKIVLWCL